MKISLKFFICLWAFATNVWAEPDGFICLKPSQNSNILQEVEKSFSTLVSLSADFHQKSYFAAADQFVESIGKMNFQKPGLMNWQYLEAKNGEEQQLFIADGKSIWWYQPKEKQVTIRDYKSSFSSDLPVSFLFGLGKISESFNLSQLCKGELGLILKLFPKEQNKGFQEFYLLVDSNSKYPLGGKMLDLGGNVTEIVFRNSSQNIQIEQNKFIFVVPKGIDIIDQRAQ